MSFSFWSNFLLFHILLFHLPGSLCGKRDGRIKQFAVVDESADMEAKSLAESFSRIKANAHLFTGAKVSSFAIIDENVLLFDYCIIQRHVEVQNDTQVGNRTLCETHSFIGNGVIIFDKVIIKSHAKVLAGAVIGPSSLIDKFVQIGRRALLEKHVCIGKHARIGSKSTVGDSVIVEEFVITPTGMIINSNAVVISAPETTILLRIIRGVKFTARFAPQVVYLVYSYLLRMHGKRRLRALRKQKSTRKVRNGRLRAEIKDCQNDQQYDKIFDKITVEKFVLVMAIHYDFYRHTRLEKDGRLDDFCNVVQGIMQNKRPVIAIKESCGGHFTVKCDGCGTGEPDTDPYLIRDKDMEFDDSKYNHHDSGENNVNYP